MFAHLPLTHVIGLATLLFTHSLCARVLQFLISTRATVGTSDCQYVTYTTASSTQKSLTDLCPKIRLAILKYHHGPFQPQSLRITTKILITLPTDMS